MQNANMETVKTQTRTQTQTETQTRTHTQTQTYTWRRHLILRYHVIIEFNAISILMQVINEDIKTTIYLKQRPLAKPYATK